ncbi:19512_t:CDS:1 [Funneliformis geosporum]|uniref:18497_t:CDS:1 n=1 Tax=Funneliformis geosporum TaxID=1117311 RepID=A0A9W4WUM1_9GLOM|nr:19512_t:CDS:1 [Funneliformis geosporum]CAI2164825.1 18497_t:CDS:1 [Funneliformis geosporum]
MKGLKITITVALAILYTTTSVVSIPIKTDLESPSVSVINRRVITSEKGVQADASIKVLKRNADVTVKADDVVNSSVDKNGINTEVSAADSNASISAQKRNADVTVKADDVVNSSVDKNGINTYVSATDSTASVSAQKRNADVTVKADDVVNSSVDGNRVNTDVSAVDSTASISAQKRNADATVKADDVANTITDTSASVKVNSVNLKRKVNSEAGVGDTKVNNDITADVDVVDAKVDKENPKVDVNAKPELKNVKVDTDNKVEKGTKDKRQVVQ